MTEDIENSLLSSLSYHDYIAMFCFWDSEWSKVRPVCDDKTEILKKSFYEKSKNIIKVCEEYKNNININFENYCKANHIDEDTIKGGLVKKYLYNPINYVTFGHSDNLSIILLDDFDPVHHITSEQKTTIEDVNISFLPKICSLNLNLLDLNYYSDEIQNLGLENNKNDIKKFANIFKDIHTLLLDGDIEEENIKQHKFQNFTPLLTFSKFKTSGQGLLFQYALFRAMAIKIMMICARLELLTLKVEENIRPFIRLEDIKSLKITLLDLQGNEEVGLLIFCNNYSLAATLIASMRSLTWEELFIADDAFKNKFDASILRKLNFEIAYESGEYKDYILKERPDSIGKNHVFIYSNSTLAIAPKQFILPNGLKDAGYVDVNTEIQISPGHQFLIERDIIKGVDCEENISFNNNNKFPDYHPYYFGVTDYLFNYKCKRNNTPNKKKNSSNLIRINNVFDTLKNNLVRFGSIGKHCINPYKNEYEHGRDIIDIITNFIIPVPFILDIQGNDIIFKKIDSKHISLLSEALQKIRNNLFYPEKDKENKNYKKDTYGKLDIDKLHRIPMQYGLPPSLRRSIEYLFQNYATYFADPYCYNSILDLYDAFTALHILLTDKLPRRIFSENKSSKPNSLSYIDDNRVEQLSIIVNALYDSLSHRIIKSYPRTHCKETGIDFRGGLIQLLFASDAPIKASLELLKSILKNNNNNQDVYVGGLIKIGFLPGARYEYADFDIKNEIKIATFELDVPHVLHPTSYIDNLHEVAHLMFDTIDITNIFNENLIYTESNIMQSRINEIFAMSICELFIFGSDTSKFLYYELCNYSQSIISKGNNNKEAIVRFSEFIIQLFMVFDLIPAASDKPYSSAQWDINEKKDIDSALTRFKNMFYKYAPFFSDFELLWKNDNQVKDYTFTQFRVLYPKIIPYMEQIWEKSLMIYNKLRNNYSKKDIDGLHEKIKKAFSDGNPILFKVNHKVQSRNNLFLVNEFYSLFLISQIIYKYIPRPEEDDIFSKRIHLLRDIETRKIKYTPDGPKWHEFQIDKGVTSMFCPYPKVRSKRLKKQIVLFKTFWDIAASQRKETLKKIIDDNWDQYPN